MMDYKEFEIFDYYASIIKKSPAEKVCTKMPEAEG